MRLVEYNVDKDKGRARELKQLGGRGVPLLNIEGIVLKGYSEQAIMQAINQRRRAGAGQPSYR